MKFIFTLVAFVLCFGIGNCWFELSETEVTALAEKCEWTLYYGPNLDDNVRYGFNDLERLTRDTRFDIKLKTVVYFHGLNQALDKDRVKIIPAAYLALGGHNLIMLDWSGPASETYLKAVRNSIGLGKRGARIFKQVFEAKTLHRENVHLIGFSLGAHLASSLAKTLIKMILKLPRVTGLDPAGPLRLIAKHILGGSALSSDDAYFVDIFRTNKGYYGQLRSTGHANFDFNGGGRIQPGCSKKDTCSHGRSVEFWAEAVRAPVAHTQKFKAIGRKWFGLIKQRNNVEVAGPACSSNARGNFYLKTNDKSPYARGANGIV